MAIRPTDLQSSLIQAAQNPPLAQRAEEAPRQAQASAQAAFVAQTEARNESIAATGEAGGNKIGDREAGGNASDSEGNSRRRRPGDPFDEAVDEASGNGEPAHLIDFTA